MGVGYIPFSIYGCIDFVGDTEHPRVQTHARLGRLWLAMGRWANGQRGDFLPGTIRVYLAGLGSAQTRPDVVAASCSRRAVNGGGVHSVDGAELRCIPPYNCVPFKFRPRIMAGEQRPGARHLGRFPASE